MYISMLGVSGAPKSSLYTWSRDRCMNEITFIFGFARRSDDYVVATLAICASLKRSFRFYRYVFCHYLRRINRRLIFSASVFPDNYAYPLIVHQRRDTCRFVLGAARARLIIGELYPLCALHAQAYILRVSAFSSLLI